MLSRLLLNSLLFAGVEQVNCATLCFCRDVAYRVDADGHAASQDEENSWASFCLGDWSLFCDAATHKANLGSPSLSSEAEVEAAYDAMVEDAQQAAAQSRSNGSMFGMGTVACYACDGAQAGGQQSEPKHEAAPKPKYVIAAEDLSPKEAVLNGIRGRYVDYGVFEVNSDGSLGYQTHKFTITLNETLKSGSHAGTGICDHNNCQQEGSFQDTQSVKEGTPYSVERHWSINGPNGPVSIPVWNPKTHAPAASEVLNLDFKKGFTVGYKDQ